VQLGVPGIVRGVVVDTRHFKGNHPESASIEVAALESEPASSDDVAWAPLVPRSALAPDTENVFAVEDERRWTHVRLSIYPDGGVARLRIHGEAAPDWERLAAQGPVNLAAIEHGGRVIGASDEFFGAPANILLPNDPVGMQDGWETRRRRGPGHDWVVVRLGSRGRIVRAVIDTRYFTGNYPESASLEVLTAVSAPDDEILAVANWREILPRTKLGPDRVHVFGPPQLASVVATHVRLRIYPDGGVARLRIVGEVLV
jgi:allantoicase